MLLTEAFQLSRVAIQEQANECCLHFFLCAVAHSGQVDQIRACSLGPLLDGQFGACGIMIQTYQVSVLPITSCDAIASSGVYESGK